MGYVAVYIDGGYLDKVLFYDFKNERILFDRLADEMAKPDELLRTYYYHCLPYQGNPPTPEERERYSSMHKFTTRLSHLPRFEVRLGRLAFTGYDRDGNPMFQQKRVDTMIGVDMALLAAKGKIVRVALLTGDSDYIPAVEAVKREGVIVTLWHGSFSSPTRPSRDLVQVCDETRQFDAEIFGRIRRSP